MIEKFTSKCKEVFLQSDIYGQSVIIHLGKKKYHQTLIGSTFTFLTALIMGAALFYFLKEFIQKQDPTIISLEEMTSDGNDYLDQMKKIKFGMQLYDQYGSLIGEEQLLQIKQFITIKLCSQENYKNCIDINISYGILDSNQEDQNAKYLFPNLSDVDFENFLLYNKNKLSQWNIQIMIDQKIEQSSARFWQITCFDSYANVQNYENPVQTFQQNYYMQLLENQSYFEFDFFKLNVQTDKGAVYEDVILQQYLMLKDTSFTSLEKDNLHAQLVSINLDRKVKILKRSYLKIQNILTQLGGLIKIVVLIFQFISSPLIKLSLQLELVNSVFQFEDQENTYDENQQNKSKNSKNIDEKQDSIIQSNKNSKNQQQQNELSEQSRNRFFNLTLNLNKNQNIPQEFLNVANQNPKQEGIQKRNTKSDIEVGEQNNSYNSTVNALKKDSIFKIEQIHSFNLARNENKKNLQNLTSKYQTNKNEDNSFKSSNQSVIKDPQKEQNKLKNLMSVSQQQNQAIDNSVFSPKTQRNKSHSLFQQNQHSLNGYNGLQPNQQMLKISEENKKAKLIKKLVHQKLSKLSMISSSQPDSPLHTVEMQQARDLVKGKKNEGFNSIFVKLFKNVTHNYLVMKFLDKIKYLLKIKFSKQQQLKFSMDKIKERLDIIFIIKKIVEIDKLKMILFDQNQLKIFEYLPRPIIKFDPYTIEENDKQRIEQKRLKDLERIKNGNSSIQDNHSSEDKNNVHELWQHALIESDKPYFQKVHEAAKAYEQLCKKEEKDIYDMRLLQFLDDKRRDYFEEILKPSSPSVDTQNQRLQDFILKKDPNTGNDAVLDLIPENQFSNKQITLKNVNIPINGSQILTNSLKLNQNVLHLNPDKQTSLNEQVNQNELQNQTTQQQSQVGQQNRHQTAQHDIQDQISQLQISISQSDLSEGQQKYLPIVNQLDFMDQINKFTQQANSKIQK